MLAYCWRCETPLSNTETRMDDVYQDRQDPALTVGFQLETGEKLLVWTTTPWTLPSNLAVAVGPDIDYAVLERDGEQVILGAARVGAYAKELADYDAGRHGQGQRPRRPHVHAAVRFPRRHPATRSGSSAATSSRPRTAPASCTWRRRSARTTRAVCLAAGIPTVVTVDDRAQLHLARAAVPGHAGLRGEQADHARPQGPRRRRVPARELHALVPALLALRHAADLQGGVVVVRRGHRVQGPDGRAQPADRLDAGAHPGRLVRQVAGERARLVDQPQPLLGLADPGVEVGRSAVSAHRRLRLARRAASATSACASPTCTGPASTS